MLRRLAGDAGVSLEAFSRDAQIFLTELWRDWVFWMCGVLGLLATVVAVYYPPAGMLVYDAIFVLALILACFRVWRKAYREARPYLEATFEFTKQRFNSLEDEERYWLKELLIAKRDRSCGQLVRPRMMGFVISADAGIKLRIAPEFEPMLTRLFLERDAALGRPPL